MGNMFDADAFRKAQKTQSSGDFPEIDPGYYLAELISAKIGKSKGSGRLQVTFDWKIDSDDEQYPNQHLWDYVGLTTPDGETNQKGYEIFCMRLSQLKASSDEFLENNERVLNSIVGTKARIQVKKTESGGNTYTNVWIDNILDSPLDGTTPDYDEDSFATYEDKDLNKESKLQIHVGMECIAAGKKGTIKFVDAAAGKVLVNFNEGGQDLFEAKDVDVISNESTPEAPEQIQQPSKLRKGAIVEALFMGPNGEQEITGQIHEVIIDDTGEKRVKILVQGKDGEKDKLYVCQEDNVRVLF